MVNVYPVKLLSVKVTSISSCILLKETDQRIPSGIGRVATLSRMASVTSFCFSVLKRPFLSYIECVHVLVFKILVYFEFALTEYVGWNQIDNFRVRQHNWLAIKLLPITSVVSKIEPN